MMRNGALLLAAVVLGAGGSASSALAQNQAAAKDGVSDYLCTFAGKCGGPAAAETIPTIAAPATKGFRLAAPQSAPAMAAPATRGFRLAAPQQAASPAMPATRSVRVATSTMPAQPPHARRVAAVTHVATPGPAAAAGAPRANLQLAFEYNSDRLTPAAQARARTFAQALVTPELKDKRFRIEGHTDSRGPRELNVDLSRRRAQAVADFLTQQGVESSRVEVKGVGPDEPLPGEAPSANANRRVEAVLLS